jgi:hypothetical protein
VGGVRGVQSAAGGRWFDHGKTRTGDTMSGHVGESQSVLRLSSLMCRRTPFSLTLRACSRITIDLKGRRSSVQSLVGGGWRGVTIGAATIWRIGRGLATVIEADTVDGRKIGYPPPGR